MISYLHKELSVAMNHSNVSEFSDAIYFFDCGISNDMILDIVNE